MDSITIRRATPDDLPTMLRIMDDALDSPEDESELPQRVQHWTSRVNSEHCIMLVAKKDAEIIGWARGEHTSQFAKTNP